MPIARLGVPARRFLQCRQPAFGFDKGTLPFREFGRQARQLALQLPELRPSCAQLFGQRHARGNT